MNLIYRKATLHDLDILTDTRIEETWKQYT